MAQADIWKSSAIAIEVYLSKHLKKIFNVYKPTKSNFTIQFICNMLKLNMYHVTSILAMEHNIWQYPVGI